MMMVIEEGRGAGTYGPGGSRTQEYLEYLCVHAYTVRHSEPDTRCIRFEITRVRSTQLVLVNFCKYKWFHPIYPVTRSQVATVINIEKQNIERSQW